jgi:hypothetical protein
VTGPEASFARARGTVNPDGVLRAALEAGQGTPTHDLFHVDASITLNKQRREE